MPEPGHSDAARTMSFWEHLAELRTRLVRSALWVALFTAAAWFLREQLYALLLRPLTVAAPGLDLNYFSITEPLFTYLRIALYAGITAASPFILWELWGFVAPALTAAERRLVRPVLPIVLSLFSGGVAFMYYMLLPLSVGFLLGLANRYMEAELGQNFYFSFVLGLCLAGGLLFELPVVLALLGWLGIVDARWLWQHSSYALVVLMIVAAVITPTPDAFTMLALTAPLMALYLLSIGIVALIGKRKFV
jgi:sec-independent protein translocase protein TatC